MQMDVKFSFGTMTDRRDSSGPFNPNVLRASSHLENGGIRRAKKSVVSVEEAGLEQGWGMVSIYGEKKCFGVTNKPGHPALALDMCSQERANQQALLQATAFPNSPFHIPPTPTQPLLKDIKES